MEIMHTVWIISFFISPTMCNDPGRQEEDSQPRPTTMPKVFQTMETKGEWEVSQKGPSLVSQRLKIKKRKDTFRFARLVNVTLL